MASVYGVTRDNVAGFWSRVGDAFKGRASSATHTVADSASTVVTGAAGAISGAITPIKKPLKWGAVGALITGGVVAGGAILASMRSSRRFKPAPTGNLDALDTLNSQPTPAMLNFAADGPAAGQPEGRWQNYVEARRNGGVPMRGDMNPAASVVPEDVQSLNTPPVRT